MRLKTFFGDRRRWIVLKSCIFACSQRLQNHDLLIWLWQEFLSASPQDGLWDLDWIDTFFDLGKQKTWLMITEFFRFYDNISIILDDLQFGQSTYFGGWALAQFIAHLHLCIDVATLAWKLNHRSSSALRVIFTIFLRDLPSVKLIISQCRHVYWNQAYGNFYHVMLIWVFGIHCNVKLCAWILFFDLGNIITITPNYFLNMHHWI